VVLALQDRLAYAPTFEGALASLFGESSSTLSGSEAPRAVATATGAAAPAAEDMDALIAQAGRAFADYQRLTSEGKLGEAGQKLDELKRALDRLSAMRSHSATK
jgi:uncharacterized membrane protein (UPF0182 family)